MSNPTSAKFSNNAGMPKFPVESNGVKSDEASDAPYGGVVEKYSKRAELNVRFIIRQLGWFKDPGPHD